VTVWITPEQAAANLPRFNADWVRQQLRTGALDGTKVGGRWLTTVEAVDSLIKAGTNSTATPRRRRRRAVGTP